MAVLELSQAGVNLMEFTRVMADQLPQDQEALDLVEDSVAQARETTRQAAPCQNWPLAKDQYKPGVSQNGTSP